MNTIFVSGKENKKEILLGSSDHISEHTLRRAFKLENEVPIGLSMMVGERSICLSCEESERGHFYFVLPKERENLEFRLTWNDERRSRPQTSMISRPRSSFDVCPESPYPEAPRPPAPMSKSIDKWMFFARDEAGKSCVVCIHPHYFITFRHGTHLQLRVSDSLTIYKAKSDSDQPFIATVVQINEMLDFILLKCDEDVVEKGPQFAHPEESECFLLAGYGNTDQNLSYLTGIVHVDNYYFRGTNSVSGPFILGTGVGFPGDSGGACWSPRGLIGISLGCTTMPTAPHHSAIFSPKNCMISSIFLSQALQSELAKERSKSSMPSPPNKKPCHTVTIEGIGTGELICD